MEMRPQLETVKCLKQGLKRNSDALQKIICHLSAFTILQPLTVGSNRHLANRAYQQLASFTSATN